VVGVFKDWMVIVVSSIVFHSVVTPAQWVGYSVAFGGVVMYTHYKYTQMAVKANPTLDPTTEELETGVLLDDMDTLPDESIEGCPAATIPSPKTRL
jgi:hypothetical protein